jgi:hypothetical protein
MSGVIDFLGSPEAKSEFHWYPFSNHLTARWSQLEEAFGNLTMELDLHVIVERADYCELLARDFKNHVVRSLDEQADDIGNRNQRLREAKAENDEQAKEIGKLRRELEKLRRRNVKGG